MQDGTNLQIKDRFDRHHLMSMYASDGKTWKQKAQVRVDSFANDDCKDPRAAAIQTLTVIGEALVKGDVKLIAEDIAALKKQTMENCPSFVKGGSKRPALMKKPSASVADDARPAKRPAAMKRPSAAVADSGLDRDEVPSANEIETDVVDDSEPEIPLGIDEVIAGFYG
jgi:hypothetical protein